MLFRISGLPRRFKILIMVACDVLLLPLALWSAIALRFGSMSPDVSSYAWLFLALPFITVPIFVKMGLYRAIIRYLDDKIIYTVIYGVSLSVLILMAVLVMGRATALPRSSIVIYWVIAIAYITSSRIIARGLMLSLDQKQDKKTNVAIYGAGRAGIQTARALSAGIEFRPVAFFDDKKELQGSFVAGLPVFDPEEAMDVLKRKKCRQLLIALPSSTRTRRREIIRAFEGKDIFLKTLPGMGELVGGRVRIEDIREVGVEDLLGRDPVPPFPSLISASIENKNVMVTGAGGSIGSELCRQIMGHRPQSLILFEQSEYALYKIERELKTFVPSCPCVAVLGDVLNQGLLESVMRNNSVHTVYHAAAYKHVPLVEANIISGVMNNVFGTLSGAQAAMACGVENFVLISTDKAVRPTSMMGATKRLSEMVLQGFAAAGSGATRFSMVRFGNVLGSSGSVVPLFREQIKNGGPVTVTHPDVTRYFMTIPEAAQLVLQAASLGKGGDVFVLDMGESIKIFDLAKKMIELSGLEVFNSVTGIGDIAIEFVGLRPGEKLYEELLIGNNAGPTPHPRILRAEEEFLPLDVLLKRLVELRKFSEMGSPEKALAVVKELVREYK